MILKLRVPENDFNQLKSYKINLYDIFYTSTTKQLVIFVQTIVRVSRRNFRNIRLGVWQRREDAKKIN